LRAVAIGSHTDPSPAYFDQVSWALTDWLGWRSMGSACPMRVTYVSMLPAGVTSCTFGQPFIKHSSCAVITMVAASRVLAELGFTNTMERCVMVHTGIWAAVGAAAADLVGVGASPAPDAAGLQAAVVAGSIGAECGVGCGQVSHSPIATAPAAPTPKTPRTIL